MSYKRRSVSLGISEAGALEEARFWAKVQRGAPEVCWPWVASVGKNGYGQFSLSARFGRTVPAAAHRVSWELANGRHLVAGEVVCHTCDTKRCVNPSHLFVGTQTDNMRDASRKGRLSFAKPSLQKVTSAQVQEMRALVMGGMKRIRVAERFGVTPTYITQIMSGKTRVHDAPFEREVFGTRRAS